MAVLQAFTMLIQLMLIPPPNATMSSLLMYLIFKLDNYSNFPHFYDIQLSALSLSNKSNKVYYSNREVECLVKNNRNELYNLSDRKSTRLNSSHVAISYAVFCLKKKITAK